MEKVFALNCEHVEELTVIEEIAQEMLKPDERVRVFLRINPNIDPDTHKYLTTGI